MSENEQAQDERDSEAFDAETPDSDEEKTTATEQSIETDDTTPDEDEGEPEPSDDVSEELVERVEESDPEQLAREIESLRERIDDLHEQVAEQQSTIDELESSRKRKQAEFENYKKRTEKRREQERKRATEDLVSRFVDVRDNLQRGLDQEGDIRDGVEATLRQFDQILEQEHVVKITPEPGDEVDPQRHEVLMRVDSDQPEGTIDDVHRPGYEMAEKVIRTAQVTVSDEE